MADVQAGVLYSTDTSLSIAIATGFSGGTISNEQLLSFCKEGLLLEILSKAYENISAFLRKLSAHKAEIRTILLDEALPTIQWVLVAGRPCLEVQTSGSEGAVFSICLGKSSRS